MLPKAATGPRRVSSCIQMPSLGRICLFMMRISMPVFHASLYLLKRFHRGGSGDPEGPRVEVHVSFPRLPLIVIQPL